MKPKNPPKLNSKKDCGMIRESENTGDVMHTFQFIKVEYNQDNADISTGLGTYRY
jgi:hypothetical protein